MTTKKNGTHVWVGTFLKKRTSKLEIFVLLSLVTPLAMYCVATDDF
jgi:hypothetical protein